MASDMQHTSETPPTLNELPDPPSGKTGWPWTEQSEPLPERQPDGSRWPKISIVTPSYNYGQFVEKTIRSVLLQRYPNLEYIVVDGGSTDETVEVLEKYDPWIDSWISEADRGQSDAINKGFNRSTGSYGSWINSDDWLCQNALVNHVRHVGFEKDKIYVGVCLMYENEEISRRHRASIRSLEELVNLPEYWRSSEKEAQIVQPETLFPLHAFREVGGVNPENHFSMDFELWGEMLIHGSEIETTDIEYGAFRKHDTQKTTNRWRVTESLFDSSYRLIGKSKTLSSKEKKEMKEKILEYKRDVWYRSGRLARMGIPKELVVTIRKILDKVDLIEW